LSHAHIHSHGGSRDARTANRPARTLRGLHRGDRLLDPLEQPALGSHLVTPRRGFAHHGIYVGGGNVIHYKSVAHRLRRFPVQEVSLARFALGREIWIRARGEPRFDRTEVARRARSRLGEDRYRILSNNCEHFCEWCLRDERRSYQVESLLALPRRLLRVSGDALARLFPEHIRTLRRPPAPYVQHFSRSLMFIFRRSIAAPLVALTVSGLIVVLDALSTVGAP
jgi:hypothetical protein